jgi:hypothetical protein
MRRICVVWKLSSGNRAMPFVWNLTDWKKPICCYHSRKANKKLFKVNSSHPLYSEINSIVRKYFGLDVIVNNIASRLGDLDSVYLTGDIAEGKDTGIIDLALIGKVDRTYLSQLVEKAEKLVNRKIAYLVYSPEEWMKNNHQQTVLIWNA